MKLIIDALPFENGKSYGFQEYLFNLLNYFYNHSDDLFVDKIYIVTNDKQTMYFEKFSDKFSIIGFKYNNIFTRLLIRRRYPHFLNLNKKDIILFTGNTSALNKKCINILVSHDLIHLRGYCFQKNIKSLLFRIHKYIYIPRSLKIADHIIAISEFTKNDILSHKYVKSPNKISVIYNYFNFDKYSVCTEKVNKKKYRYFLTIASEAPHKNVVSILKAFELYSKRKSSHLVYVGKLSKEANLHYQKITKKVKEKIHIYNNISNETLAGFYKNASVFISASLFEGLGMPVVEAMNFGLPVLLSEIDIHKEVSFNKGFYFNPFSYEELSRLMISSENIPCENFSNVIKSKYSDENTSKKYVKLINSLSVKTLHNKERLSAVSIT